MDIPQDGNYYLVIANCHPTPPRFNFSASLQAVNPHGHLSARLYGLLPFYRCAFWVFFPLTLLWTVNFVKCYKYTLKAHGYLTAVLILCAWNIYIQFYVLLMVNKEGEDYYFFSSMIAFISDIFSHLSSHIFLVIVVSK